MKVDIGSLMDATDAARALRLNPRTVVRVAKAAGATVEIGGKSYVLRRKLRSVFRNHWREDLSSLECPVRGKGTVDTESVMTRREVAERLGVNTATVWRIASRHGIGVEAYHGQRLFTREMLPELERGVGVSALTREQISEQRRNAAIARWSRRRAAESGTTGTGGGGSPSRPSRPVSR